MKVEAELTVKDYEAFFRAATRRAVGGTGSRRGRARYWLIFSINLAAWIAFASFLPSLFPESSLTQTFLFVAVYAVAVYFWRKRSRRLMAPEQGGTLLGSHGALSYSLTKWPAVRAIEETPEHVFVFVDKTVAHIVPKRCFPQSEDYQAFLRELRERVQGSSDARSVKIPPRLGARRLIPRSAFCLVAAFLATFLLSGAPLRPTSQNHQDTAEDFSEEEWEEAEDLLYSQLALVEKQNAALLPERPGIVDLYFVGFGGDADQDVFMNEALYAQHLFDRRFDTRGRSLALINNRKTRKELPLASFTNLRTTLHHVGRLLNPEEDVLFLFLTSHGSRDHILSVKYWPLPLKEISSADLAGMLDESGIKWRVVIISACYSGGFIDGLKNDHTLIITSSAATRPSFGCGKGEDLTYFGKAFFKDQLSQARGILQAFAGAAALIRQRETAEKLKASEPQLSSPPAIIEKLQALEARLESGGPH